jgi:hypothetical protein
MISDHTKALARLQTDHRSTLDKLKSEYDLKLTQDQRHSRPAAPPDELVDSINATRSQISDELEQKAERQEIQIQERLLRLTNQITTDRRRSKQLEQQIDQMRRELEDVKAVSSLRKTEITLALPIVESVAEDDHIALANANWLSEENEARAGFQNQVDGWRKQLRKIHAKSNLLQKKIRDRESGDSAAVAVATQRHTELKGIYESLMTDKNKRRQLHIQRRVADEKRRQSEVGDQTGDAQAALTAVKLEREKLLKELRRLDYMVYGRSGRYQVQKPNPNRKAFG